MERPDIIIVGGGIAGASMATVLARSGLAVLVLERTSAFKDENRGELLWPWGVREAQRIGVLDDLLGAGGHVVSGIRSYSDQSPGMEDATRLDGLVEGVPGSVNLGHPTARQALLDAAASAGAAVVRGVRNVTVKGGRDPSVAWHVDRSVTETRGRLVIGADGRHSTVRRETGIELLEGPVELYAAGMLVHGTGIPSDANIGARERDTKLLSFPQKDGHARLYHCFPVEARHRYDGRDRAARFLEACHLASLPYPERWSDAEPAGPCSTFPCSDAWVVDPVADGIALIGDAGGYSNYLIGQGLSLAFRDVAVLSQLLVASEDWSPNALSAYGLERGPRLKRARYLAHLDGWMDAWFRDDPRRRAAAARLAAADDLLQQFPIGRILTGYEAEPSVPVDALWARLDELDDRMAAEVGRA